MKKLNSNLNHTLCHPEEKPKDLSRFFTTFKMTVCLSSSCMTAVILTCLLLTTPTQAKWGDNCTLNGGTIIQANQYGTQNGVNLDKGGKCNDPNNPDLTNNCNGMKFCMSNNAMNWWSAFTWCDSIGGKLASFEHMCPGTQRISNTPCDNLKKAGTGTVWSSAGLDQKKAFYVRLADGIAYASYNDRNASAHSGYGGSLAFCEE